MVASHSGLLQNLGETIARISEVTRAGVEAMTTIVEANSLSVSRAGQDANGGWLEVANEGPVIPPNERERIFEPFEQGSIVRQGLLKGSGMGLSIARESAMSLGGELKLIEDKQADVCFRLDLK